MTLFNNTSTILPCTTLDGQTIGIVLPHSNEVLSEQEVDRRIKKVKSRFDHLTQGNAARNIQNTCLVINLFLGTRHDEIASCEKRLEVLTTAKTIITQFNEKLWASKAIIVWPNPDPRFYERQLFKKIMEKLLKTNRENRNLYIDISPFPRNHTTSKQPDSFSRVCEVARKTFKLLDDFEKQPPVIDPSIIRGIKFTKLFEDCLIPSTSLEKLAKKCEAVKNVYRPLFYPPSNSDEASSKFESAQKNQIEDLYVDKTLNLGVKNLNFYVQKDNLYE